MNEQMKILIAYDGSAYADAALADLRRAGLGDSTEALLVTVVEDLLIPSEPYEIGSPLPARSRRVISALAAAEERSRQTLTEAEATISGAIARLRENFPLWHVRGEVLQGRAAETIIKRSEEYGVDLIVVGSHGHSALGRLVLGSVSQRLVTDATCAVRIGRGVRVKTEGAPVRLVIGVDGSLHAEEAVRAVAQRNLAGSEAYIVAAFYRTSLGGFSAIVPALAASAEEANAEEQARLIAGVEFATETLRAAGLTVTSIINEGDAQRLLLEAAEAFEADCIFVGSRGLSSRIERWRLGSVSAGVAPRAECSVEVVRKRGGVTS